MTPPRNSPAKGFERNPAHLQAIRRIAAERVVRAADKVTQRTRALLGGPGSGIYHPGNAVPASAPGEPPARQSGSLEASQTTRGPVHTPRGVTAASGTDDVRGKFLQLGTAQIRPRPYSLRGLIESERDVLAAFAPGSGEGGGA
jgi:hypothetical protein